MLDSFGASAGAEPSLSLKLGDNAGFAAALAPKPSIDCVFIDAGTRHLRLQTRDSEGVVLSDLVVPSNSDLQKLISDGQVDPVLRGYDRSRCVITGKLAQAVHGRLGGGKLILPAAAFWLAARDLIRQATKTGCNSLAMIDLSASGYLLIGVEPGGDLKDDLLLMNPRCGAGSGINLDRVLQKLGVDQKEVDRLLADYVGQAGRERREQVTVRIDRCGVFSTSATVSDKNQGIPLHAALATTLKSEILKAVKKLPPGFDKVYLTGRIFRWQYARDCAADLLHNKGVAEVAYDPDNNQILESLRHLVAETGVDNIVQPDSRLNPQTKLQEYPSFSELKLRYEVSGHYRRMVSDPLRKLTPSRLDRQSLVLALDVGSTMAKVVLAESESGQVVFLDAYSNAGDTIETLKKVFVNLRRLGVERLPLHSVGITGSARYQVQQALSRIYPGLAGRIAVLVENYAHARGSVDCARRHIAWLKQKGHAEVNEKLCILVDIGGEDTKISTIALEQAELFDNAMNTKCSAGTGSLMDTLSAMFDIKTVAAAQAQAYTAPRSFAINATCAVFLMENASKLQARGMPREQILASANWAIVENMARTLWSQLELPGHAVVLLHGQTMLSDPLPLAVTHRLQSYIGNDVHALVPSYPGHRACIGLIRSMQEVAPPGLENISLQDLLEAEFEKRVIQCKGAVCGDPLARCNRCALRWQGDDGRKIAFTVGGCTAINELLSRKGTKKAEQPPDAYKEIWDFIDSHHPRSDARNRLVVPSSFAVSEWAYFLARVFEHIGLPVHVDNVRDSDLSDAQPDFNIDTCAPQIGAVGQYRRLAGEPHGMILAPQIVQLPTNGKSSGLTCSANQGGVAVASNLATMRHPDARIHLFHFSLERLDASFLCDQLITRLAPVFDYYDVHPDADRLEKIIKAALAEHTELRNDVADLAAGFVEQALDEGRQIALVVGREYVLNPGIYDSHIRRLLRERQLTVIPSYVLDLELDPEYSQIYWRNPHAILTTLKAVAHRALHLSLRHPRLREVFRRIEQEPTGTMLPVVQVSTFSCGPDSIIAHYVAEIMKQRPFLLVQSDAVLKELAHLENRVNTYVKQLQQGLHEELGMESNAPFEIKVLDELSADAPLNRETDVLCWPTLGDNRTMIAVCRGAGFTCLDNYEDASYDLQALVKTGRTAAGQAICAPLAALYADLQRGVNDFARRKQAGDPSVAGKHRLILIDSQGTGPCRQGQYQGLHRLFFYQSTQQQNTETGCNTLPGGGLFQFHVLSEDDGYSAGFDERFVVRAYQGLILKGVLQNILFKGGAACRDYDEYQRFLADYEILRTEIYRILEAYDGPGSAGSRLLRLLKKTGWASFAFKYFLYRLHGREFTKPLRRFAARWIDSQPPAHDRLRILISGEGYMRLAQAEEVFRILLGELGFQRFDLELTPVLGYLEYLLEDAAQQDLSQIAVARAAKARRQERTGTQSDTQLLRNSKRRLRKIQRMHFVLRQVLARPLYKASRLHLPPSASQAEQTALEILPTLQPRGELGPYIGEALMELRHGRDVVLNIAPSGCMVSSMGEVLTPKIMASDGVGSGRIQSLLSADGEVDEEVLTLAMLKAMGPERYYRVRGQEEKLVLEEAGL